MPYQVEVMSYIIRPDGEPLFSEQATIISRADAAGGEFIEVDQGDSGNGYGKIAIDKKEWAQFKWAIEDLLSRLPE